MSVFGRNLTDTRYFTCVFATDAGDAVAYAAPWSIGGGISVRF
jgi:outer membrane receptor protein involved in Fe transport